MNGTNPHIRKLVSELADAVSSGASAEEISSKFYADNTLVAVEGIEPVMKGRESFTAVLATFLDAWGPSCKLNLELIGPAVGDSELVSVFAQASCQPTAPEAPVDYYRVMMVWKSTTAGWRIIHEMATNGKS